MQKIQQNALKFNNTINNLSAFCWVFAYWSGWILSPHSILSIPSAHLPSRSPNIQMHIFLFPMRATCPAHFILFDLTNPAIYCEAPITQFRLPCCHSHLLRSKNCPQHLLANTFMLITRIFWDFFRHRRRGYFYTVLAIGGKWNNRTSYKKPLLLHSRLTITILANRITVLRKTRSRLVQVARTGRVSEQNWIYVVELLTPAHRAV